MGRKAVVLRYASQELDTRKPYSFRGRTLLNLVLRYYGVFFLLATVVTAAAYSRSFLGTRNIVNILRQSSIDGLLATGQTLVILTGGIDLSVGSLVAVSSVLCALYQVAHGGVLLPCLIGILACGAIGLLNGALVAKGKLPPFIVTLGMMGVARALALVPTKALPVVGISEGFEYIAAGNIAGIPAPTILWFLATIVIHWVLVKSKLGWEIYSVGGNERAARLSGVNTHRVKLFAYTVCGMFAGLAGVVYTSRLTMGQPTGGVGFEFTSIACVVIGGASLFGGKGSVLGTFLGVVVVGVLNNLMNLLGISPFLQEGVKGLAIIAAVYASLRSGDER